MTTYQCCPQCKTPMPCFPDGRWYTFVCACGYQGYPLRYTVTGIFPYATSSMLTGGFPLMNLLSYAVPEPELPAWARPDREPVPDAFQQAFAEGELEP